MDSDWQLECLSVKSRDLQLLEKGYFSDCSFEVGDKRQIFLAHKLILAKSSPVFATMFFGSMAEPSDVAIKVVDIQPEIFSMILEYLYTDKINLKSYQDTGDLIYASKKYMLNGLLNSCKDYLIKNVSSMNALKLYELGQFYEEKEFSETALRVIRENTRSVLNSPDFGNIDLSIMIAILEQDTLDITEIELFQYLESLAKIQGVIETAEQNPSNVKEPTKEFEKESITIKNLKLLEKFRNAAKKIKYLSMTATNFANGPIFSKLLLTENASAIIACLVNSENIEKHYPKDFSRNKRQLTNLPQVSFEIIEGTTKGRLVIELRPDIVPLTVRDVQNIFVKLKGSALVVQRNNQTCLKFKLNNDANISFKEPNVLSGIEIGSVALSNSNELQIKLQSSGVFDFSSVVIGKVISGLDILYSCFRHNGYGYAYSLQFKFV